MTERFCCDGCRAAYRLLHERGLALYYRRRTLDPALPPLRPEEEKPLPACGAFVRIDDDTHASIHLMVDGLQCAACVWLIETLLMRASGVETARLNMTTRRLSLRWRYRETSLDAILAPVLAVGYRLVPYDPAHMARERRGEEKRLLRLMGIAGCAAGNIMLLSVSVWAGDVDGMGAATRSLLHWVSALIALPALIWCLRPFLRSALASLRGGWPNMDVPICLGVALTAAMSLFETIRHGPYVYFDAAVMLMFFLLVGRYLDSRARGRACAAAEDLLLLRARAVTVLDEADREAGRTVLLPPAAVRPGMTVLVAAGERIGVDAIVSDGDSTLDTSLITGESLPSAVKPGDRVFAGTLNLDSPLRLRVTAREEDTLLADIVRLMENAENKRGRVRLLTDRIARLYTPVVHLAALSTFVGWAAMGLAWQAALLRAVAVLIITCPCALALAVPAVQVVAAGRLMRRGILLKSSTALERLAEVDHVVFDKTGTLTEGRLELQQPSSSLAAWTQDDLRAASSLAASSRHPLARALRSVCPDAPVLSGVREVPGQGLEKHKNRLGNENWCRIERAWRDRVRKDTKREGAEGPELWLSRPGSLPVRFPFADRMRADARSVVEDLKKAGLGVEILSGDRPAAVAVAARQTNIDHWQAGCTPQEKHARLKKLAQEGRRPLMVGDGLNDAPALAAAHASMSLSSGTDISQNAADVVFQGERLAPVIVCLRTARKARRLIRQNLGLALSYNLIAVPLAVAGYVTPLVAALSMSASSLLVILNALRLGHHKRLDRHEHLGRHERNEAS